MKPQNTVLVCVPGTGCKRREAATRLPAEFKLAHIRAKVGDSYLCRFLFLSKPCVETPRFSFRLRD